MKGIDLSQSLFLYRYYDHWLLAHKKIVITQYITYYYRGGEKMNQHIHCIVSDCNYWEQGNKCVANEILVATDQFGATNPEEIDAHKANQLKPESAGDCMTTCCKSFIPKDSPYKTQDGIKKMK